MNAVRTAVIPAGGLGTRFFPVTRAVPKELLPVLDRPAIDWAYVELASAGIEHVVVLSSVTKDPLARHLRPDASLADELRKIGRDQLADLASQGASIKTTIVNQEKALGLGHAVACAHDAVGDEPFFVVLPDDLYRVGHSPLGDMTSCFIDSGCPVLCVQEVDPADVGSYGVVEVGERVGSGRVVTALIEKPEPADAPSNLAIVGRYLLTPDIFPHLHALKPGTGGELQLTDGLAALAAQRQMLAFTAPAADRLDIGTPAGWLRATVLLASADQRFAAVIDSAVAERDASGWRLL